MPFKGKRAHGGKRKGAGRKPTEYTQLRRRVIEASVDEAEKSFDFYVQVRDNPNEPTMMRKLCADAILNRVIGMPRQPIDVRNLSDEEIIRRTQSIVSTIGAILSGDTAPQLGAGQPEEAKIVEPAAVASQPAE